MPDNQLMRAGGADASIYAGYGEQPNALGMIAQMQATDNARTANQLQQFELANRQLGALRSSFSSLASKPDLSHQDIISEAGRLVAAGIVPQEMAAREIQASQALGNDPAKLKQFVTGHLANIIGAQGQLDLAYPQAQALDTGGGTQFLRQNRLMGSVGPAAGPSAYVPSTMTPGQAGAIDTIPDPTDPTRSRVVSRRQALGAVGDTSTLPPARRGSVTPIPVQPQGGIVGPQAGQQQGQEMLNTDLAASAGKIAGTRDLIKAIQLVDELGPNATGPSSDTEARIKEFLTTRGLIKAGDTNVVPRQELAKYLQRYAISNPVAQRSDMGTLATKASVPNMDQALPAISELAKNAIASDRMEAALPGAFDKNKPGADYPRHKSTFMQQQDPLAYRIDLLPQAEAQRIYAEKKADYLQSKDPQKKAAAEKFLRSLVTANRTIFKPDGGDAGR